MRPISTPPSCHNRRHIPARIVGEGGSASCRKTADLPEPASTEVTVDRKAVRSALRQWHNTQGLGEHPLARLSLGENRRRLAGYRDAAVGRGLALRDVLRRSIDTLRPDDGEPDMADERWRGFVILSEQYLAGRKPDYVTAQLSLARSTYDHEQAAALDRLANVLREWDERPPPDLSPARPDLAAPFMAPPRHPDGLIGRAELFGELRSRVIEGRRDIALHGPPGVGKTALAVELAHDRQVREAFPDGVLWAGLGQRSDLAIRLALWGAALGLSLSEFAALNSTDDRARLVHTLLGPRRALLVVDDVWDPSAGLVFRLGGEGCARLFTCRSGATALVLAPDGAVHVPELDDESGVGLLQRSTGVAGLIDADEARPLVAAVGAHPLALVLTGRYLGREWRRRDATLRRLAHAGERLKIQEARSPLDQQPSLSHESPISLEVVVGLSDDSLSQAGRRALRRLAFFPPRPGSFGESAALAAILGPASGQPLSPLPIGVEGEVDKQVPGAESALVELEVAGLVEVFGDGRDSLHPVISDYARARADRQDRIAFAEGLLSLAVERQADRRWAAVEADNLLAALDVAEEIGMDEEALRGSLAVFPALEGEGRSAAMLPHLERAESIARARDTADLIRVLAAKARVHQHLGDYARAAGAAGEALDLARAGAVTAPQPELLLVLGAAASSRGGEAEAEQRFQEGLRSAEAARMPALIAAFEANLDSLALKRGDASEAESRLRLALRLAQAAGDRVRETSVLINLGVLLAQAKRFDEADASLLEAADLAQLVGTLEQRVFVLTNLGALANDRGRTTAAETYLTEALGLARLLGDPAPIARLLANLGVIAAARGDHESAEAMYAEGLELARASGHEANVRLLEHNLEELRRGN